MALKETFDKERKQLIEYILSDKSEDAKRDLILPLFSKLFRNSLKTESEAKGADVYIEGKIIVECKTRFAQWVHGFYQALHYHKRYGLSYSLVMVIAHKFVGIWKVNEIPEFAVKAAHLSDPVEAPTIVGRKNALRTSLSEKLELRKSAVYWLEPKDLEGDFFKGEAKSITKEAFYILDHLKHTGATRLQINLRNFIEHIELLMRFFDEPIDAVHCFYSIVAYWDITSVVSTNERGEDIRVTGFKGHRHSEKIGIKPQRFQEFKKCVENRYVFTNEGSGIKVDNYFSRFDEVMARIDPEYVKQHGIFFTDINLSKFALWFAKEKLGTQLDERYIWFDPAGGSGNLISSWRGNLKHKIISELQPDLLKIIERRMKVDPWHVEKGFTIIPKTSENQGLNFLDCAVSEYLEKLERELRLKNIAIDKPLAFLLNPPYKNTDENEQIRESVDSNYQIHESILRLTGSDAGKERYLAFLGQILNMAEHQIQTNPEFEPIVLIFTPTSWLVPRPTYRAFRQKWDKHFEYLDGFIITSNEFFKLQGTWPLAFTIWKYKPLVDRENTIILIDFTKLRRGDLDINWSLDDKELDFILESSSIKGQSIIFKDRNNISETLPVLSKNEKLVKQPRFNFYRNRLKDEIDKEIISGFPLRDDRHQRIIAPHGYTDGRFVGFMDDNTPVRIAQDTCKRQSNEPDRIWFRLDTVFINVNQTKAFNGPSDNRSFCAYDLESAKATFSWFSLTKAINSRYPTWANQFDIWAPEIAEDKAEYWNALCFAFVLSENRCIVTKFEADNPVKGAPEIFVDNPLSPANPDAFWAQVLDNQVIEEHGLAFSLVNKIKEIYRTWNFNYCKGDFLYNVGLQDEPYFKYFDYPSFLTPYSGLIQIRKFAEMNALDDINSLFVEISELTKLVREEIYRLLVEEFQYFD